MRFSTTVKTVGIVPRPENVEQGVFSVHQKVFTSGVKYRISMEYGVIELADHEYRGPEA